MIGVNRSFVALRPLRARSFATAAVGFKIPENIDLTEDSPANKVSTKSLFSGRKVVLFGLPGAFTPGCSKTHLPGYVQASGDIKKKGVDEIVCVTINDAFVTGEWKKAHGAEGKVRVLADHTGALTKALGLEVDLSGPFGAHGLRSKRYSAIVVNGAITALNVEPDGTGLSCSLHSEILKQL